jgi:hypothetical protein
MRETIDAWTYVWAAYAVGVGGTLALVASSWLGMKRAEARRDRSRGK